MTALRTLFVVVAALLLALPVSAREKSLDAWFDSELVPAVNERLQNHPRFKGQSVMFVVIGDNKPAAVSNALALSLRDRLLNAALDTGNIRVAGRQGDAGQTLGDAVDCRRDATNYYIGVEVAQHDVAGRPRRPPARWTAASYFGRRPTPTVRPAPWRPPTALAR